MVDVVKHETGRIQVRFKGLEYAPSAEWGCFRILQKWNTQIAWEEALLAACWQSMDKAGSVNGFGVPSQSLLHQDGDFVVHLRPGVSQRGCEVLTQAPCQDQG